MILSYDGVKEKPDTLRAMTSLNRNEFEELCTVFGQIEDEKTGQLEKEASKGGRKPILRSPDERLFFILFYLKTYPLQAVLAHLFGMSQGQANFLIYHLSEILRQTLKRTGHLPARIPEEDDPTARGRGAPRSRHGWNRAAHRAPARPRASTAIL